MNKKHQLDQDIQRDILRLRAQNYRQQILASLLTIKNPWKMIGSRLPWLAKGEELASLVHQLKHRKHAHPLWRMILGASVLARLWWKNKKR